VTSVDRLLSCLTSMKKIFLGLVCDVYFPLATVVASPEVFVLALISAARRHLQFLFVDFVPVAWTHSPLRCSCLRRRPALTTQHLSPARFLGLRARSVFCSVVIFIFVLSPKGLVIVVRSLVLPPPLRIFLHHRFASHRMPDLSTVQASILVSGFSPCSGSFGPRARAKPRFPLDISQHAQGSFTVFPTRAVFPLAICRSDFCSNRAAFHPDSRRLSCPDSFCCQSSDISRSGSLEALTREQHAGLVFPAKLSACGSPHVVSLQERIPREDRPLAGRRSVDLLEQESATSSDFPFSLLGLPRFLLPRVRALSGLILVAARSELLLFTAVHKFILSMLMVSRLRILQSLVLFLSRQIFYSLSHFCGDLSDTHTMCSMEYE
jgi:hypothetical protein